MSPVTDGPTCAERADDLAALAVGALTGRERVEVLAHVDHCPSCAAELESMVAGADALLALYPEHDPGEAFTERVMAGIGVEQGPTARRRPSRRVTAVAAAVVVLALAGGAAAALTVEGGDGPPANVSATLQSPAGDVGRVVLTSDHGNWLFMTMDDAGRAGAVTCRVTLTDGSTQTVGRFSLHDGYGTWAVKLPVTPAAVASVTVVDQGGQVVASASV